MGIHHATLKKAEKMGIILSEQGDEIEAKWPEYNVVLSAQNASDAMREMQAVQAIKNIDPDVRCLPAMVDEGTTIFHFFKGDKQWGDGPALASDVHAAFIRGDDDWQDEPGDAPIDEPETTDGGEDVPVEVERSEKGIALDGAVAYSEGTPAGDNPYFVDDDASDEEKELAQSLAEAWDEAWDAAADEAEDGERSEGGSVVKSTYRARYTELGHPTHCGDWLAETLNNLCQTSKGIDLDRFETICEANGVDLSKYNRETRGWEGRLRMTGRNLLAKKVYLAGGILLTPVEDAEPQYKAPKDWMAAQRYKMPKKDQAKPIPEAAAAE